MILCEYGCEQKANYSPGKGRSKWCCSEYATQCIEVRRKNREANSGQNNPRYGKTFSEEAIKKMCKDRSGKNKMTFKGKDNPFYGNTHTKETLEKKSKNLYEITYPDGHKEFCKVFSVWCKENNINQYKLWYESKKERIYNGYFCRKII